MTNAILLSETQGRYIISVKDGQTLDMNQAIEIGQLTSEAHLRSLIQKLQFRKRFQTLNIHGRSNRSMFNNSGLNEECGVFGIWNHPGSTINLHGSS